MFSRRDGRDGHRNGVRIRIALSAVNLGVNPRALGFWLWPIGIGLLIAAAVASDVALVALGYLPAGPALILTFGLPAIPGLLLGLSHWRADWRASSMSALITSATIYGVIVAVSLVGVVLSSNISCAEPNAPWNCDNDTGSAVGLVLGLPLAGSYGFASWLGSLVGSMARRTLARRGMG